MTAMRNRTLLKNLMGKFPFQAFSGNAPDWTEPREETLVRVWCNLLQMYVSLIISQNCTLFTLLDLYRYKGMFQSKQKCLIFWSSYYHHLIQEKHSNLQTKFS